MRPDPDPPRTAADSDDPALPPYAREAPVVKAHEIPREVLDEQAVFVVRRLQQNGHEAYLVGGCVRDLLAGLEPKDFDVATDAYPNRIKRLFRSARVIGRRFRLVHVRFPGDHIIETATFRGDPMYRALPEPGDEPEPQGDGRRRRDWRQSVENIFGTAPEDAHRRDFTINALFYDPVRHAVIDYVGGLDDMQAGVIRAIGEPGLRIEEDPVRMLRAVHFAKRLDFRLEETLETAIRAQAHQLDDASQARLYIELIKILSRGRAHATLHALHELGVLQIWLPELTEALDQPAQWPEAEAASHTEAAAGEPADAPIARGTWGLLGAADAYGMAAHQASEALALAVLFGPWILASWDPSADIGYHGFRDHVERVFRPIALRMSVPKYATARMHDMLWMLRMLREPPSSPKQRQRLLFRPCFRDAVRLFELSLRAKGQDLAAAEAWRTEAQEAGVVPGAESKRAPRGERPPRTARSGGERGRGRGRGRRGGRRRGGGSEGGGSGGGGSGGRRSRGGGSGGRRNPPAEEAGAWLPPPAPDAS